MHVGNKDDVSVYRRFTVRECSAGHVEGINPIPAEPMPLWAQNVSQEMYQWTPVAPDKPCFKDPIPFVIPPLEGSDEPFLRHNHCPSITWMPNGDLLAVWYTCQTEKGTELTTLAARLRAGTNRWDSSAEFFKANERNMHGNCVFYDEVTGIMHHANGMGSEGAPGFSNLALLHRYSLDNGKTWTAARPISTGARYRKRHLPNSYMRRTPDGTLFLACDISGEMYTALHASRDGGFTWSDTGGAMRGVHAAMEMRRDGHLMACGRTVLKRGSHTGENYDPMPISVSADRGKTWTYSNSDLRPIGSNQRPVLMRLQEGPLLLISFTTLRGYTDTMPFVDAEGNTFEGCGMFAALSRDEGNTWPVRKLITPGDGFHLDDIRGIAGIRDQKFDRTTAEIRAYPSATQTPDGMIHLISSSLHYRFNLAWLEHKVESC